MANFTYQARLIQPKGKLVYEYNPLFNYRKLEKDENGNLVLNGELTDLTTTGTDQLNFSLNHPVEIICQESYDKSINLILNDNNNQPRLINTRFTARENNTYERVDRLGNTDTNIYDQSEFEIDSSLLKKYNHIPAVTFNGVFYGGSLPVGNYVFYFKLSDADGNETDIVAESGLVVIHMGALNTPSSMRGGEQDENSGKLVQFTLKNIDSGYDYVTVYYSRATGVDNNQKTVTAAQVLNKFRVYQSACTIHITGNEEKQDIPVSDLSQDFFLASKAKTQAVCQNMLFLGNVTKATPNYETFSKLSLGFVPYYKSESEEAIGELNQTYSGGGYYKVDNIYKKVGYWNEELYRFGIVYIMNNGALTPVYNIRGINNVSNYDDPNRKTYKDYEQILIDYDTGIIDSGTMENSAGVCRINDTDSEDYFKVRHFIFIPQKNLLTELKKLGVKGYFFVRQKRIPTILCQAFMIGRDTYSGIPCWQLTNGENKHWITESFLDTQGYVTHDYSSRLLDLDKNKITTTIGICPEFELDQAYYNNLFTGSQMTVKTVTKEKDLGVEENHIYLCKDQKSDSSAQTVAAKIISVADGTFVRDGKTLFRATAGTPNELKYVDLCKKNEEPIKKNFAKKASTIKLALGKFSIDKNNDKGKIQIVRGNYGPYLGIYNQTALKPNTLINIYIPGFQTNSILEYFKIRINCEDAYYPVTDRMELSTKTDSIDVYRGDCYISQFTHRINRNFQDPDAPNNDTIVESDTWRSKYDKDLGTASEVNKGDINAVRIGTYLTFKCYTTNNMALRDVDAGYPSEESLTGSRRSFYPLQPLRVDGNYKIPESTLFNKGFSTTTGERVNFLQPAVPYIKNIFQTRIVYSDIAQTDAFKNGFRVFQGMSYRDYSNQYGGIMRLVEWGGNLIVVFEHAIGLAQVNQNAMIPTDDGTNIQIGAQKVLSDTLTMISTDVGTQWPESVCCSQNYIYGLDTVAKKIWRTNGRNFECISDFKVTKFLNDNITLSERELTPIIGVRNVKTHYNAFKDDLMFTYYDNTYGFEETVWNLCYNEQQQAFTTFYSWLPSYSANIDNVFFTYDRNSSKWISKLGMSESKSVDADGVCVKDTVISNNTYSSELSLNNRSVPVKNASYEYTLERDNFGNYNYFTIEDGYLKLKDYDGLRTHLTSQNPVIPCVQLNIQCNIFEEVTNGEKKDWAYSTSNLGYYQSQVFLTFEDIKNNDEGAPANFTTDFWKHGFAGLIDVQEKIKPCYWYGKQHPFEFEYVVGNDNAGYKQFDNIIIASNNVAPESIHYTIIGDSYDFSVQKPAMYWRQEATKALYQYLGSDILYDHKVFDAVTGYLPEQITAKDYIETDRENRPLRNIYNGDAIYKDTLFTLIYHRQNTFNEIEDYYKQITATKEYSDYPNVTGGEIQWDSQLDQFSICNHVKCRDVKEVGRTRANIQYINDKWVVQITPLNVLNRNNTWTSINNRQFPKLVVNNAPDDIKKTTINDNDFPQELKNGNSKYIMNTVGDSYKVKDLDSTDWSKMANARKEVKLMDKYMKTRIRYKGDKLAIILATVTQFNTIAQ